MVKQFKQFTQELEKSSIPSFNHYSSFCEKPQKPQTKKNDLSFDNYSEFSRDRKKSEQIKESSQDWSDITRSIHDTSLQRLGHDPERAHSGIEHDTEDHFPAMTSSRWEEHEKMKPLIQRLHAHYSKFKPEHLYTIKRYSIDSRDLNVYLHRRANDKIPEDPHYEDQKSQMMNTLRHHGRFPHGHYVYSGIGTRLSDDPTKQIRENGVTRHNMFVSTSPNMAVTQDFTNPDKNGVRNLVRIYIPGKEESTSGTPRTAHIGHHSNYTTEDETIMAPGHVVYHPTPTVIRDHGKNKLYHMYHGILVPKSTAMDYHREIKERKAR